LKRSPEEHSKKAAQTEKGWRFRRKKNKKTQYSRANIISVSYGDNRRSGKKKTRAKMAKKDTEPP